MVDEFSRINADIDIDIMTASMKDPYFGDVDMLRRVFTTQLRKLASWIGTRGTPCLSLRHGHRGCNSDVGPNR